MSQTDTEHLAAIRERLEAATPGPWVGGLLAHRNREDILAYPYVGANGQALFTADGGWGTRDDAEFIAHTPEDIAYLLSLAAERDVEYESLAAEYAELSERHEQLWEETRSLRARIDAAGTAFSKWLQDDDVEPEPEDTWRLVRDLRAALAGDQPEAVQS